MDAPESQLHDARMQLTTTATLNLLFPPEFQTTGRFQMDIRNGAPAEVDWRDLGRRDVANGRALQAEAESEAAFFEQHSFVLLPHRTAVKDWDLLSDPARSEDVLRVYYAEIEQLIAQRLFPGKRVEVQQWSQPVRRGRDTPEPGYVNVVHCDYGLTPEDYEINAEAYSDAAMAQRWRSSFDREEVEACTVVDFWRPTGMSGPLLHMPLALCDPTSVDVADLIPTTFAGVSPTGQPAHQTLLRLNSGQRWYYYPRMDVDEVLAFKLFEWRKDDPSPHRFRNVFHSAFEDPDTPEGAQERQSCEHRVGVMILRD